MNAIVPSNLVIRTPDQRLRVFVSSTLGELAHERRAVLRAITALRLTPVMFESGARPHPPQELYRAYLAQSDVFIGMYWQHYGQLGPGMQVSGLEEEFEQSQPLPRLLYVKAPAPHRDPRLTALLSRIKHEASYRTFGTASELARLVRDDLAALLSERFAASRPAAAPPQQTATRRGPRPLPAGTTSLVGREQAIDEVASLLRRPDTRLITLTGPGGVGKTRLAVAVGESVRDRFQAGTAFVPLATVMQPEMLVADIGRAVGIELSGMSAPLEVLAEQFGDGAWLLILDNLEQVVGAVGDLDELLARCRGVAILATSVTVLRLRAEREYGVPPLSVPAPAEAATMTVEQLATVPAVALFIDRAIMVRHDFALTERNAAAVAAICRRLEGLPLAIELAAARIRLLEPEALLDRLAASLDALGTGAVDVPERQRTLRATVECSVGLLEEAERSLLETAAVFVDGWTIEAAVHVAGLDENRVLHLTEALARHSLIQLVHTENGPRSRMLETIRGFVCERLAARSDLVDVQRRHADYYRALAERADRPLRGIDHIGWLEVLQLEAGNLGAAVHWYLDHDPAPLPHLFRILYPFLAMGDMVDYARAWVHQLTPAADSLNPEARAELLWAVVATAIEAGGDDPTMLTAAERLQSMVDGLHDPYMHAVSQLVISWTRPVLGDLDGAQRGASDALAQLRSQNEPYWTVTALFTTGFLETAVGRDDAALGHMREARDLAERFGNPFFIALARMWLGTLAVVQRRLDDARVLLAEALDLSLESHTTRTAALCLVGFARLAFAEGDPERAARLVGAADGLRRRAGLALWPPMRPGEAELAAQVRRALGADRFDQLFADGSRLSLHAAVAAARESVHAR